MKHTALVQGQRWLYYKDIALENAHRMTKVKVSVASEYCDAKLRDILNNEEKVNSGVRNRTRLFKRTWTACMAGQIIPGLTEASRNLAIARKQDAQLGSCKSSKLLNLSKKVNTSESQLSLDRRLLFF